MKVNFYATLRQIVGTKTVDISLVEGATVRQLVDEIINQYPALSPHLIEEDGELCGHVHLIVNGRDATFLDKKMETVLSPDDTVSIFPPVGGG
jgi:molybdopterin synthase sulfur carrier subunit